ncbi:MAG: NAD-dependent epimerase/dehydratase family protein [Pyrinomonadaceae bacterium]
MSNPAKTRILVTGGTGFIGRHVVSHLTSDQLRPLVTVFNKSVPDNPHVDFVNLDLTDRTEVNQLIAAYKPQVVLHLAGVTGNDDPSGKLYDDVNYNGTINLLSALEKTGVSRVVMLGSAAEYGNQPIPFKEDVQAQPVSHYAVSKAKANEFALELHASNGLPVTILRVFTAYGFGQPDKMFLSQLVTHGLLNQHFSMSDGLQRRDFVYVEDVAAAIMSAMTAENVVGRIINVASGNGTVLRDLAQQVWKICGADSDRLDIGSRDKTGDDSFDTEADISLAQELLNWRPGPAILSDVGVSPALTDMINRMRASLAFAK